MSKHTPGQWTAEAAHRLGFVVYANIEPFVIVESADDEGRYGPIASEANARLIASAPELLKALESVAEIWDHHCFAHGDGVPTPCHAQVRAVIAKAKGEA